MYMQGSNNKAQKYDKIQIVMRPITNILNMIEENDKTRK